jgi:hypothetical protein
MPFCLFECFFRRNVFATHDGHLTFHVWSVSFFFLIHGQGLTERFGNLDQSAHTVPTTHHKYVGTTGHEIQIIVLATTRCRFRHRGVIGLLAIFLFGVLFAAPFTISIMIQGPKSRPDR